ncbi:MAG: photosystem II manganese-stabilizing polypeptide [Cyanobacteria bacterium P01_H01_bin.15]
MRFRTLLVALCLVGLSLLTACGGSVDAADKEQLTYKQVLNTGLANLCPSIDEVSRGSIPIEPGQVIAFRDMCLEPQEYFVKEEPINQRREAEFVQGKVLTRKTSTLDQIRGEIRVGDNGTITLVEKDGLDFQAITVLLPGGEQTPFLFTIKKLVATTEPGLGAINTSTDFEGEFSVPSYRGNVFLDPKGRGIASGYDNAVALPSAADSTDFNRANVKTLDLGKGEISLQVTKLDSETGEIAGIFSSEQPSDTDLGADEPEEVKIKGIFYARLEI